MSQVFVFFAFAAFICLVNGYTFEPINITEPDTPSYQFRQNETSQWTFTFWPNLRGFIIFDEKFTLEAGEQLSVYNGKSLEPRYCLANYTRNSTIPKQRLTFGKGQSFTVIFYSNSPTPSSTSTSTTTTTTTTTPSTTSTTSTTTTAPGVTVPTTTMAPEFFMFLVSSYDEQASLMNNTQVSGTFNVNVTDQSLNRAVETFSGVSQYWHFYPIYSNVRLSFLLQNSSALNTENNTATLTLYRGNADNLDDNSTIIKTYQKLADFDTESHIFDFGETLSLYFNYPSNNISNPQIGYKFIVSPTVNGTITTTTPVTDASGNPINSTNPTMPGISTNSVTITGTGTVTVQTTTTTSAAVPFMFSLAPIIISLFFQMCQSP